MIISRLFAFGCLAHDPQCILAAVRRLAFVSIELGLNVGILKLSTAPFTDSKALFHDPQFALRHDFSLAHWEGRA